MLTPVAKVHLVGLWEFLFRCLSIYVNELVQRTVYRGKTMNWSPAVPWRSSLQFLLCAAHVSLAVIIMIVFNVHAIVNHPDQAVKDADRDGSLSRLSTRAYWMGMLVGLWSIATVMYVFCTMLLQLLPGLMLTSRTLGSIVSFFPAMCLFGNAINRRDNHEPVDPDAPLQPDSRRTYFMEYWGVMDDL